MQQTVKPVQADELRIGWGHADLTPDQKVLVRGQFHARVSEGVKDPIGTTALALEAEGPDGADCAVLVSCDLASIPDGVRDMARERLAKTLPGLDPMKVCINATHTHTAPDMLAGEDAIRHNKGDEDAFSSRLGVDLDVMDPADYAAFVAERIAEAAAQAWNSREPGGIGFAMGQAVVGRNRRMTYDNGESRMYGKTDVPDFNHVEGYEDHSIQVMGTYSPEGELTGLMVNVACPSQVSESEYTISADYWHETREELRRRLGAGLNILPQCSAAGDQSPRPPYDKPGEERMLRLAGRTPRQEIAVRIADAVEAVLPCAAKEIAFMPLFAHRTEPVELSRRNLIEKDVEEALEEAKTWREQYEALAAELEANPAMKDEPRWYVQITRTFRRMRWFEGVKSRFELQQAQPKIPVEPHVIRIGGMAITTNPFEYYLDYGIQIKARSRALQTFVVQLAGSGTYVPTERAVAGKSYGAVPASTPIGPEGGRELVEWTVAAVNGMWPEES